VTHGAGPWPQQGDHVEVDPQPDGSYRDAALLFETPTHFHVRFLDTRKEADVARIRVERWHPVHGPDEKPL
jgi:hypothetical protein